MHNNLYNIQLNRALFTLTSNLKGNIKQQDIFRESILLCFLKISISLNKTCTTVYSEIPFTENSLCKS